ncbi:MAG: aspartate/glutamate racemase family protein [Dehalococcoidia bacterium]|nr:aspartate/glutamate racemase family protein [Dehalococcoidia bacterium]
MVYGFMPGPEQVNAQISMLKGQAVAGSAIGILVLDLWYPYMPGNVANASTFNFPVLYKILKGSTGPQILSADPVLLDMIVEGGRELEQQGVRAIIGACGYFGNFQKEAAAILDVPVYLSSLLQIPIIRRGLKPNQKVGVICAVADSLTPRLLSQCGVDDLSDIVIVGAQDLSEFKNIIQSTGHFNNYELEQQMVGLAKQFVSDNPDIGAILFECSDMPPYAWAVQNAVGLPVFDFTTLINWVYNAVVRRPFAGFV